MNQSPLDNRVIDTFVLANGMRALVVSDPETDMAAAAVDVHVGQFSDPWDRQGLAHFLEHMLFMGTEKYPEEDAYRKFIQDHGGSTNAGTGQTHTRYHFQVSHDFLEPSLDRFAQFFIAPKLDPAYVERERNAVHAEYKLKVKDDARRIREVRRSTSNPEHPFAKFSVGNQDTLADRGDDTVWADLKALYDAEYSASRMTVVVVGREDVATLRKMVTSRFGLVASDGRPVVHTDVAPFLDEQLAAKVLIVPLQEQRTLTLEFLVPPTARHFHTKPASFLTGLIGHEGEGSLHAYLKAQGWSEALSAGTGGADDHALLTAEVKLTEAGLEHVDEIIDAFFAYTALIEAQGITAERFDEERRLGALQFQFAETADAVSTVNGLSYALHQVPPEHVIDAAYLHDEFDEDLIRDYASRIRPENMRVLLVAPGLQTDRMEARYQAPYALVPLTSDELARWNDVAPLADLRLPEPNAYIADDVSLDVVQEAQEVPSLLIDRPQLELWHHQDVSFEVPKATVQLTLFSDAARVDTRARVLNVLFGRLLDDSLEAFGYPLREAGVGLGVWSMGPGLGLQVNGYDDKHVVLLDEGTRRVREFQVDADRFELVRDQLVRQWRNTVHNRPISQTAGKVAESLRLDDFTHAQGIAVLEALDLAGFEAFVAGYFDTVSAQMLVHGNHDAAAAQAMANIVQTRWLDGAAVAERGLVEVRLIPSGEAWIRDVDIDHDDSTIVMLFQGQGSTVEERAPYSLLGQLLRTPFFTQLRTEQQLGYVVGAGYSRVDKVPGIRALIQSSVVGPKTLQARIEAFLTAYRDTLVAMEDDEFNTVKEGLIADLLEREERLGVRSQRYLRELSERETDFKARERAAEAVRAVSKADILALYDADVLGDTRRLLMIRSTGRAHAEDAPAELGCVDDVCFEDRTAGWMRRPR